VRMFAIPVENVGCEDGSNNLFCENFYSNALESLKGTPFPILERYALLTSLNLKPRFRPRIATAWTSIAWKISSGKSRNLIMRAGT